MTRLGLMLLIALASCRGAAEPESRCAKSCKERVARCSDRECARGCAFILDRIVEREDGNVLACMAREKGACDDPAWASCAAQIGIHADGGPGAPGPLPQPDEQKREDEE